MSRHESFINRAVGVALTSECRWRHGAVIARGSRTVSFSPNIHRNDPDITHKDSSWHAEDAVLRAFARTLGSAYGGQNIARGTSLYVARVNTKNEPVMSRPCVGCWEILVYSGITDVYFTNELGTFSHERVM